MENSVQAKAWLENLVDRFRQQKEIFLLREGLELDANGRYHYVSDDQLLADERAARLRYSTSKEGLEEVRMELCADRKVCKLYCPFYKECSARPYGEREVAPTIGGSGIYRCILYSCQIDMSKLHYIPLINEIFGDHHRNDWMHS